MAHTDRVPDRLLDDIAVQIGARVPLLLAEHPIGPDDPVEITETFEVLQLSPDQVRAGSPDDLRGLVGTTHHHQVAVAGRPALYARSAPRDGRAGWTVVELAASPLAAELDRAITVIDAMPADDLVRLLVAPAYHLHAFLLLGTETRVVVVRAARRLADLPRLHPFGGSAFLATLRAVRPIVGMG